MQRVVPKPGRISSNAGFSFGGEGVAAIGYFFDPIGLFSGGVGAIAISIARQGRLHFTHSSGPLERRAVLQRLFSMYHLDKYVCSAVAAQEVAQCLRVLVELSSG